MYTGTTIATALAIAIAALASPARADSMGERADERRSIQHAESVVVGTFTGATSRRIQDQRNAIDANGSAYTARIEVVVHEFAVTEQLDGVPTPATISIIVPGALALPAPRRRIVIGIRAEGATPKDGYNLMYGRALEADTDARLAQLRDLVKEVREPAPVDPQALVEAVGMHEAEARPDEPNPGGPVGPDDPAGPARASFSGPPQTAPRVSEPQGDPSHPPESAATAAADEPGEPGIASPRRVRAARRSAEAPAAIGATTGAPGPTSGTRWPFAAVGVVILAVAALWWRRTAHA